MELLKLRLPIRMLRAPMFHKCSCRLMHEIGCSTATQYCTVAIYIYIYTYRGGPYIGYSSIIWGILRGPDATATVFLLV